MADLSRGLALVEQRNRSVFKLRVAFNQTAKSCRGGQNEPSETDKGQVDGGANCSCPVPDIAAMDLPNPCFNLPLDHP